MKAVKRRLDRLEDRLAPQGRKQLLIILSDARQKLTLDSGRCVQILREAGHLDTRSFSCCVDVGNIPDGLNAAELEQHLREHGGAHLCRDTGSGDWVLIENQLERTDHTHLGQLLTYAAGLDAVTVVWVSPAFTEEHRAALDWLNKVTGQRFNFFGLEIEAWRIGDSPIAVKFNPVSKPNAWVEEVTRTVQEPSGAKQLQPEYWTVFKNLVDSESKILKAQKPLLQNWTNFAIGKANFLIVASVNAMDKRIRVALEIRDPEHKAYFNELQQQQAEIDKAIGASLQWRELAKAHFIELLREQTDPANREDWPTQHAWLLQTAEAFYKAFSQRIKGLTGQEEVLVQAADASP